MTFKDKTKYIEARYHLGAAAENAHAAYWVADRDSSGEEYLAGKAFESLQKAAAVYGFTLTPIEALVEDAA